MIRTCFATCFRFCIVCCATHKRSLLLLLIAFFSWMLPLHTRAQTVILSSQFRPASETKIIREVLLRNASVSADFQAEDPGTFVARMQTNASAGSSKIGVAIGLSSELAQLDASKMLMDVTDLYFDLLRTRAMSELALDHARFGGRRIKFVPFLQTTFMMVADKQALAYLPKNASLINLTYAQLIEWGENIKKATGVARIGLPAGNGGLLHRFFQGHVYPSYTGGVVSTFRDASAEAMWADMRKLWAVSHPNSNTYASMADPLNNGEVWIAFDHTVRLLGALNKSPDRYVAFPAPAGPRGRYFVPIVIGLAIPANVADRSNAFALVDHLTRAETQRFAANELGLFPAAIVSASDFKPGMKVAYFGLVSVFAHTGQAASLPVGLGARSGDFNKIFVESFQRIVIKNEDISAVLAEQARLMDAILQEVKAPCWSPDLPIAGKPCVVMQKRTP